jgi:hypothetical protein
MGGTIKKHLPCGCDLGEFLDHNGYAMPRIWACQKHEGEAGMKMLAQFWYEQYLYAKAGMEWNERRRRNLEIEAHTLRVDNEDKAGANRSMTEALDRLRCERHILVDTVMVFYPILWLIESLSRQGGYQKLTPTIWEQAKTIRTQLNYLRQSHVRKF